MALSPNPAGWGASEKQLNSAFSPKPQAAFYKTEVPKKTL
jgi:hypothetical protein